MSNEQEDIGPGEKRLAPVDVDVLDNLINAQAAYMEALNVAFEHNKMFSVSDVEIVHPLFRAFSAASGAILLTISAARV